MATCECGGYFEWIGRYMESAVWRCVRCGREGAAPADEEDEDDEEEE